MLVDILFDTQGRVDACKIIDDSSLKYKEGQDHIAEFIRDKIATIAGGKIKKQELNSEFTIWYMNTYGKGAPNPKEVHAYMDKKFGKFEKNGAWINARIKYDREEVAYGMMAGSSDNSSVGSHGNNASGDLDDQFFEDNIDLINMLP
jgi:hypothetical protein